MIFTRRYSKNDFVRYMSINKINDLSVKNFIKEYFICLNATGWKHSIPYFKESHDNVINLYFDDVENDGPKEIQWFNNTTKIIEAKAMTIDQAIELKKFINRIPDNSIVHIHCTKGLSRSAAVENFINETRNNHIVEQTEGNIRVYNLLKEVNEF